MTNTTHLIPLKTGDKIALTSTSGYCQPERIIHAENTLQALGFETTVMPHTSDKHIRADYLAGSDENRAKDFMQAWLDDSVTAIMPIKGGYGVTRMLDYLDKETLKNTRSKIVFGSSDLTALHEYLREEIGIASWFTPMAGTADFYNDTLAALRFKNSVTQKWQLAEYANYNAEFLVTGQAEGELIGGNLTMLTRSFGAKNRTVNLEGNRNKIVLLEDITEDLYRIDSMLVMLLRAGYFDNVSAIICGSWVECGDINSIRDLVIELLAPLNVPLVWEFGFGHCHQAYSIPLGVPAKLFADKHEKPVLHLLS